MFCIFVSAVLPPLHQDLQCLCWLQGVQIPPLYDLASHRLYDSWQRVWSINRLHALEHN